MDKIFSSRRLLFLVLIFVISNIVTTGVSILLIYHESKATLEKCNIIGKIPASDIYHPYFKGAYIALIIIFILILVFVIIMVRTSVPIRKNIEESEYFFKKTQQAACIGSYKTDFVKGFWTSSEVLDQIFGIDATYNKNIQGWLDIVHPEDKEMMDAYLRDEVIEKHLPFDKEYRIIRKSDGETRWVHGLGRIETDDANNITLLIGTIYDISDRKITELLLKEKSSEIEAQNEEYRQINEELYITKIQIEESEETYRMLFESINDAVFIIETTDNGKSLKFIKVNDIACQRLGYTMDELLCKTPYEINSENGRPFVAAKTMELLENGHSIMETEHVTKEGKIISVEMSSKVFQLKDKTLFHSVARDITQRKQTEILLQEGKEKAEENVEKIQALLYKAEESDRLKTAFLQNVSHEIRTPMNAIMGFSELLALNYNNKPKLEKFSEIIKLRCKDLLDIINDLLDIARIESGQLPVNPEKCNFKSIFTELTQFFKESQKQLGKQNIKFTIDTPTDASGIIFITDKVKLKQILINLVGNAFKFTETGQIKVGYSFDEEGNVVFYVSDTGIGIPESKYEEIFDRFTRIDSGLTRIYGGTGLGLSIVKGLVNLLNGKIWLTSSTGVGSTFYFSLPVKKSFTPQTDEPIIEKEIYPNFPDKSILLVEDDMTNTLYFK